jgi:hypothetical protein
MSRREIVLLVSRAIALLLVIPAVIGIVLSIPTQVLAASMRESLVRSYSSPALPNMFRLLGFSLLASLLSLGLHLFAAMLFWQCGPMIERMLLPAGSAQPDVAA